MTDPIETMLRTTFDADADAAPPATGLARAARERLRRRRLRLTGGALAVAAVATAGGLAFDAARPARTAGPPAGQPSGTVEVVPEPTVSPALSATTPTYLPDDERLLAPLRRPLRLPELAPGAECPVSRTGTLPAGGGFSHAFGVVGNGPFFLTGPTDVQIAPAEPGSAAEAGGWSEGKVIWAVDGYQGPVLLRGARIDAPAELGLVHYLGALGQPSTSGAGTELAYPGAPDADLRTYPSGIRVRDEGCYALQADGTDFSYTIVFRARFR